MKVGARISLQAISLLTLAALVAASQIEGNWQTTQSESRDKEIAQFIAIIRDSQLRIEDPNKVVEAINKLGEMKAVSAVDDLVQLLSFRPISEGEFLTGIRTEAEKRFPAMGALFSIGKPALPSLIKIVENFDEQDLMSKNAAFTIVAIFREKPSDGVDYLHQSASQSSALGKQRILNLVERMNRLIR